MQYRTSFLLALLLCWYRNGPRALAFPIALSLSSTKQKFLDTAITTPIGARSGGAKRCGFGQRTAEKNAMILCMTRHRLSHAMLMVPSVQKTVDFWKEYHAGIVTRSSQNEDGTLKGAFVELGTGDNDNNDISGQPSSSFALEITTSRQKNNWKLGSSIGYIGVSLLTNAPTSSTNASGKQSEEDPNGIPVRRVASAPGDPLARFCLRARSAPLEAVEEFYANVLGMSVKAVDDRELCLRFDNDDDISLTGVPTTLVFEAVNRDSDEAEEAGNCIDHIVIETEDIERDYERIQKNHAEDVPMFMKLTEMFGTKLFGVRDPNGYKVILAGKIPSS